MKLLLETVVVHAHQLSLSAWLTILESQLPTIQSEVSGAWMCATLDSNKKQHGCQFYLNLAEKTQTTNYVVSLRVIVELHV